MIRISEAPLMQIDAPPGTKVIVGDAVPHSQTYHDIFTNQPPHEYSFFCGRVHIYVAALAIGLFQSYILFSAAIASVGVLSLPFLIVSIPFIIGMFRQDRRFLIPIIVYNIIAFVNMLIIAFVAFILYLCYIIGGFQKEAMDKYSAQYGFGFGLLTLAFLVMILLSWAHYKVVVAFVRCFRYFRWLKEGDSEKSGHLAITA